MFFLALLVLACNQSDEPEHRLSDIRIRDPFILADSATGTYYLYAQMGNRQTKVVGEQGVEVYTSHDLEIWYGPKPVFRAPDDFWGKEAVWAPEVHSYQEKYYLFVTFTSRDSLTPLTNRPTQILRGTQILVADTPEGPFKPFANAPHTPKNWMALDGTFWLEDGIPYMVFCHEWIQTVDGTIELARLKDDLSAFAGEPQTLFTASSAPWVRNLKDVGSKYRNRLWDGYVSDGCFLYRTKNGKLLMLWSSIGDKGYALGVVESQSGKIAGPWKQRPEPMFSEDGGHGMIFKTFDGRLMLVLHQPNRSPQERAKLFELVDTGDDLMLQKEE